MVSAGQMAGMVSTILLPLLVAVIPYILIYRRSSKIESGMMGAIGYGFMGFVWQQLIYLMLIILLTYLDTDFQIISGNFILSSTVYSIICGIFVALGLYWGIYLTNQKQRSLYRSAVIGIGFGLGSVAWNIWVTYGMTLYEAFRINTGSFSGEEELKASILSTSVGSMLLDSYKCILLLLIYLGVALIMGKSYLEGTKRTTWAVPIFVQLFISLTNAFMRQYMPALGSKIAFHLILTVMAAAAVWIVVRWLKTGNH
ncbi:MAG: hypothetical protein J1F22_07775 [Lachnospiraceae bacterium]|nr:hypothetical protein [Lachnospiraceae bacterium]